MNKETLEKETYRQFKTKPFDDVITGLSSRSDVLDVEKDSVQVFNLPLYSYVLHFIKLLVTISTFCYKYVLKTVCFLRVIFDSVMNYVYS